MSTDLTLQPRAAQLLPRQEFHWLDSLQCIAAEDWDRLHDGRNPFVSHAFLSGLEYTGCLHSERGWQPHHLTLWEDGQLRAATPGYLKHNSHGEFVFDHAWAQAHAHHGLDYFPKWLGAVPYSPVTGPRLLALDAARRPQLLAEIVGHLRAFKLSSGHINFHTEDEDGVFTGDWLTRMDVQYHWRNPGHWRSFDDYLAAMNHKYRKNIRQERRKVEQAGVTFRIVHGDEASAYDLEAMHQFYLQTFVEYGNTPALTLDFFQHLAAHMPRQLILVLAEYHNKPVAGALYLRGGDTLYGRYWGAHATLPGLHFETCYYQGIEYCLREGLRIFEPGAQGEHKLARGFLPVMVRSRHWIAEVGFHAPLRQWCAEEAASMHKYAHMLGAHSPFRNGGKSQ